LKSPNAMAVISTLLLVVLLAVFHTELYVTGVRIYVAFSENPRAERYLGDYYHNNAQKNVNLSDQFYVSSLKGLLARLNTAPSERIPNIHMAIGGLYECGKGVPQSYKIAADHYGAAVKAQKDGSNPEFQAALMRALSSSKDGNPAPVCTFGNEVTYLRWFW
jgi:hypothetical protein